MSSPPIEGSGWEEDVTEAPPDQLQTLPPRKKKKYTEPPEYGQTRAARTDIDPFADVKESWEGMKSSARNAYKVLRDIADSDKPMSPEEIYSVLKPDPSALAHEQGWQFAEPPSETESFLASAEADLPGYKKAHPFLSKDLGLQYSTDPLAGYEKPGQPLSSAIWIRLGDGSYVRGIRTPSGQIKYDEEVKAAIDSDPRAGEDLALHGNVPTILHKTPGGSDVRVVRLESPSREPWIDPWKYQLYMPEAERGRHPITGQQLAAWIGTWQLAVGEGLMTPGLAKPGTIGATKTPGGYSPAQLKALAGQEDFPLFTILTAPAQARIVDTLRYTGEGVGYEGTPREFVVDEVTRLEPGGGGIVSDEQQKKDGLRRQKVAPLVISLYTNEIKKAYKEAMNGQIAKGLNTAVSLENQLLHLYDPSARANNVFAQFERGSKYMARDRHGNPTLIDYSAPLGELERQFNDFVMSEDEFRMFEPFLKAQKAYVSAKQGLKTEDEKTAEAFGSFAAEFGGTHEGYGSVAAAKESSASSTIAGQERMERLEQDFSDQWAVLLDKIKSQPELRDKFLVTGWMVNPELVEDYAKMHPGEPELAYALAEEAARRSPEGNLIQYEAPRFTMGTPSQWFTMAQGAIEMVRAQVEREGGGKPIPLAHVGDPNAATIDVMQREYDNQEVRNNSSLGHGFAAVGSGERGPMGDLTPERAKEIVDGGEGVSIADAISMRALYLRKMQEKYPTRFGGMRPSVGDGGWRSPLAMDLHGERLDWQIGTPTGLWGEDRQMIHNMWREYSSIVPMPHSEDDPLIGSRMPVGSTFGERVAAGVLGSFIGEGYLREAGTAMNTAGTWLLGDREWNEAAEEHLAKKGFPLLGKVPLLRHMLMTFGFQRESTRGHSYIDQHTGEKKTVLPGKYSITLPGHQSALPALMDAVLGSLDTNRALKAQMADLGLDAPQPGFHYPTEINIPGHVLESQGLEHTKQLRDAIMGEGGDERNSLVRGLYSLFGGGDALVYNPHHKVVKHPETGEDMVVGAWTDGRTGDEVSYSEAYHRAMMNMSTEFTGLIMSVPQLAGLFVDILTEPFSGRPAQQSMEIMTRGLYDLVTVIGESAGNALFDVKKTLMEEGLISQALWYAGGYGAIAKFVGALGKLRYLNLVGKLDELRPLWVSEALTAAEISPARAKVINRILKNRGKADEPHIFEGSRAYTAKERRIITKEKKRLNDRFESDVAKVEREYRTILSEGAHRRKGAELEKWRKRKADERQSAIQKLREKLEGDTASMERKVTAKENARLAREAKGRAITSGKTIITEATTSGAVTKGEIAQMRLDKWNNQLEKAIDALVEVNESIKAPARRKHKGGGALSTAELAERAIARTELIKRADALNRRIESLRGKQILAKAELEQLVATKVKNPLLGGLETKSRHLIKQAGDVAIGLTKAGFITGLPEGLLPAVYGMSPLIGLNQTYRLGHYLTRYSKVTENMATWRWVTKKRSKRMGAIFTALEKEAGWAFREATLLTDEALHSIPLKFRATVRDVLHGQAPGIGITALDIIKATDAKGAFQAAKVRRIRAMLDASEKNHIPGLIWSPTKRLPGSSEVGAWIVNPDVRGIVKKSLEKSLDGTTRIMNKWGRNLTRRSLELTDKMQNLYWTDSTGLAYGRGTTVRKGMFQNADAINGVYWPQIYREWGAIRRAVERILTLNNPRGKEAIRIAKELRREMNAHRRNRRAGRGGDEGFVGEFEGRGAQTGRLAERKLDHVPIRSREKYHGMSTSLLEETVKGLADAEFSYQQFRLFNKAAKDPRITYQGVYTAHKGTPGWDKFVRQMKKEGWTYVDEGPRILGTDVPKMGPLAGRFVRSDILLEFEMAERAAQAAHQMYGRFMKYWKGSHTFGNPATTFRNFFTNVFILAPMADINMLDPRNWRYYKQALKDFALGTRSKSFVEAFKAGAFEGTFTRSELGMRSATAALTGFVGHVKGHAKGAEFRIWQSMQKGVRGDVLKNLPKAGRQLLWDNPGILYSAFDDFFRYVAYLKKRNQGWDSFRAAGFSRDMLINYDDIAGGIGMAKQGYGGVSTFAHAAVGVPFAVFPVHSTELAIKWLSRNPIKAQIHLNLSDLLSGLSFAETFGYKITKVDEDGNVVETERPDWRRANKAVSAFREKLPFWARVRFMPLEQMGIINDIFKGLDVKTHELDADGRLQRLRFFNLGYYSIFDWVYADNNIWAEHDDLPAEPEGILDVLLKLAEPQRILGGTPLANMYLKAATKTDPFTGATIKPKYGDTWGETMWRHIAAELLPPLPPWAWYTGTSKATTPFSESFWSTPTYARIKALHDENLSLRVDGKLETILGVFFGFKTVDFDIPSLVRTHMDRYSARHNKADRDLKKGLKKVVTEEYGRKVSEKLFGKTSSTEANLQDIRVRLIEIQYDKEREEEKEFLLKVITDYRRERLKIGIKNLHAFFDDLKDLPLGEASKLVARKGHAGTIPKVGISDDPRTKPRLIDFDDKFLSKEAQQAALATPVYEGDKMGAPSDPTSPAVAGELSVVNPNFEDLFVFKTMGELVDFRKVEEVIRDPESTRAQIWDLYRMFYGTLDHKTTELPDDPIGPRYQNIDEVYPHYATKESGGVAKVYGIIPRILKLQESWRLFIEKEDKPVEEKK